MSYHSDKCAPEELISFKKEVIQWLQDYGIDTTGLDIRAYNCYGGDVRVYTKEYMDIPNIRESFRRTKADKDESGNIKGYHGTRGKHITTVSVPIIINRKEWDFFKQSVISENKDCYDDYHKLEKLKTKNKEEAVKLCHTPIYYLSGLLQ